jgi:hypothetical protein
MTEPDQAPPWYVRAARQRRLHVLGWSAALLFYPFVYVFPLYRALDATYRNVREQCAGSDSYLECWEPGISAVRSESVFHCEVDRDNPMPSTLSRRLVNELGMSNHASVPLSSAHWGVQDWIRHRELPLFRQGFAFAEISDDEEGRGSQIADKVRKHCKEQRIHFLRSEPVEPIAIYGEMRALYEETAHRYDEAIAEYESIRFLFGFLMWGWAAFELVGITLFFGLVRAALGRRRPRGEPPP